MIVEIGKQLFKNTKSVKHLVNIDKNARGYT